MKNQKLTTYVLLVVVIGIWGYVVYIIIDTASEPDVNSSINKILDPSETDLSYYRWQSHLKYDSLKLSPFDDLNNTRVDESVLMEPERVFDEFEGENYDDLIYAPAVDIQYLGFVENEERNEKIAIVQINDHQQFMRVDQLVDGILLKKIDGSEIAVQIDQELMTIPKQ